MKKIDEILTENINSIAIVGHVRPDGDCVGSCMGLYNYLKDNYTLDVDVYLDDFAHSLSFMRYSDEINKNTDPSKQYDLVIAVDCSDRNRLGKGNEFFETAKKTACIDHHISNAGYSEVNHIRPNACASGEVLYELFDADKISKETAECLYTAIIHDSGVFQYSSVTQRTMEIDGTLMGKGIDFSNIVAKTFYEKSYHRNQILGRALLESIRLMNGKCIFSVISASNMEFYRVKPKDLDGIVENLRNTEGVEVAIFLYETGAQEYKVSLRSKDIVDVSKVAAYYGGGGHVKAAGCTMHGSVYDVINNLTSHIEQQMLAVGEE